jgi:hypothetical protein
MGLFPAYKGRGTQRRRKIWSKADARQNQFLKYVVYNEGDVPEATNILYIFTLRAHREVSNLQIPESEI